ncbi:glutathione S-transferase family protein [Roseibium sp. M-1]
MILYGQFDSPFVRRTAIALKHYKIPFQRAILSVFGDFDEMLSVNPLGKVPALRFPDGAFLFDSRAIIEYFDELAPVHQRLTPKDNEARLAVLQIEAVGIGLAEKVYERGIALSSRATNEPNPDWLNRLDQQIHSALRWIENRIASDWLVGNSLSRADLAVITATTYMSSKRLNPISCSDYAKIEEYRRRCESYPSFVEAPFILNE